MPQANIIHMFVQNKMEKEKKSKMKQTSKRAKWCKNSVKIAFGEWLRKLQYTPIRSDQHNYNLKQKKICCLCLAIRSLFIRNWLRGIYLLTAERIIVAFIKVNNRIFVHTLLIICVFIIDVNLFTLLCAMSRERQLIDWLDLAYKIDMGVLAPLFT